LFWVLEELNNTDKHRLLLTVGSSFRSFNVGEHMLGMMRKNPETPFPPKMDVYLKSADNLFRRLSSLWRGNVWARLMVLVRQNPIEV